MRLVSNDDVYHPGDTIGCEGEGNPELQTGDYQWINLDDPSDITYDPVLTITDDMVDANFTYQCQACNDYLGQRHCATLVARFYVSGKPHTADWL